VTAAATVATTEVIGEPAGYALTQQFQMLALANRDVAQQRRSRSRDIEIDPARRGLDDAPLPGTRGVEKIPGAARV